MGLRGLAVLQFLLIVFFGSQCSVYELGGLLGVLKFDGKFLWITVYSGKF